MMTACVYHDGVNILAVHTDSGVINHFAKLSESPCLASVLAVECDFCIAGEFMQKLEMQNGKPCFTGDEPCATLKECEVPSVEQVRLAALHNEAIGGVNEVPLITPDDLTTLKNQLSPL